MPTGETGLFIRLPQDTIERLRLCAKARQLPLATWARRVLVEETERQAALLLYRIRVERPHELNAVVEEILRQHALEQGPLTRDAQRELLARCPEQRRHKGGKLCGWCGQVPPGRNKRKPSPPTSTVE